MADCTEEWTYITPPVVDMCDADFALLVDDEPECRRCNDDSTYVVKFVNSKGIPQFVLDRNYKRMDHHAIHKLMVHPDWYRGLKQPPGEFSIVYQYAAG